MTAAVMSPWRSVSELRLCARMYVWAYALDDFTERDTTDLASLDEMLGRCRTIVHTGACDTSDPLLGALSGLHKELTRQPLYPALSALWTEKFDEGMRGLRYDWLAGHGRKGSAPPDNGVAEYLDHTESILVWITHLPRWMSHQDPGLLDRLDALIPALEDFSVTIRLANDLSTYAWEKDQQGQNNILMYGVSADWVQEQLDARIASGKRHLAPLLSEHFPPAVELIRCVEWSVTFYALADFRKPQEPHA